MTFPLNLQDLAQFLVEAKIAAYASGTDEFSVTPALAFSHQLEYSKNNLLYRDIYYGGMHFVGMETVFLAEQTIWAMSYYGGVLPGSSAEQVVGMSSVLKAALREVPLERPFRGPESFQMEKIRYDNDIRGELLNFWGTETISVDGEAIYRLHYSGGMVN